MTSYVFSMSGILLLTTITTSISTTITNPTSDAFRPSVLAAM